MLSMKRSGNSSLLLLLCSRLGTYAIAMSARDISVLDGKYTPYIPFVHQLMSFVSTGRTLNAFRRPAPRERHPRLSLAMAEILQSVSASTNLRLRSISLDAIAFEQQRSPFEEVLELLEGVSRGIKQL
jgi:hypothetical protein